MKIGKPEKLTNFNWLNLFCTPWNNKNQGGLWLFASRKTSPEIHVKSPVPDAVIIVPVHVDKEVRRLVVCREFRIPIGDYEYAFPAGLIQPGESVIECAQRELKEETGLQLTVLKRLSPSIYSSTGLSDESVMMVFCECIGTICGNGREALEEMSICLLDLDQIEELCSNDKVKQSCKLWPILFMFTNLGTLELRS